MATGENTWFVVMVSITTLVSQVMCDGPVYRVTTILHEPYLVGISPMKGFIPDLLDEMSAISNATFVVNHVADYKFGTKNPAGDWTGMIGELTSNTSDIAAAALTLTVERQRAVHFSHPFQENSLKILVKKPSMDILSKLMNDDAALFFKPLSAGVWISVIAGFAVVCIVLYIIGRYSPIQEKLSEGGVTWAMCVTCGIASLQGMRNMPASFSGQILVSCSLLFTLLLVSMYSASLVGFVSAQNNNGKLPFRTFRDLVEQREYQYGTFGGGSTYKFFTESKGKTEMKIGAYLRLNPNNVVANTQAGVERVRNGKYAFIMESGSAEYMASKSCDLMVVGNPIRETTYNFACRQNTNICDQLNIAILQLKMNGKMDELKRKWWSGPCGFPETNSMDSSDSGTSLGTPIDLKRFTFPLIIFVLGVVLSVVMLLIEIYLPKFAGQLHVKRTSDDTLFAGQMHT